MSWLYSQALVEEYSEANASDGEQSAPSSGSHIQLAYCAPDKMTDFSKRSLAGMTFKPLTEDRGEDVLTSYLAAFPVRTLAAPEKERASQENDLPCGKKWRELSMKCVRDGSTQKIRLCLLWEEDLEPSSVTLPKWGMMQNGELWERTTLPRLISGIESGLLESCPTPTCQEVEQPEAELTETGRRKSKDGKSSHSLNLADSVKMYPTPCANEDAAGTPNGKMQGMLGNHPDVRGKTPDEWKQGQLSPDWVEWLMGWPIGWTRLEPIELDERGWETDPADEPGDIPRVATGIKTRADRLKAIGNGQVPQAAELAWRILTK